MTKFFAAVLALAIVSAAAAPASAFDAKSFWEQNAHPK